MDKIEVSAKLSKLKPIRRLSLRMEQYATDTNTAVNFIFYADEIIRFEGKKTADFGCGNGILGIAAGLMGAERVDFYDIDETALETCRKNCSAIGLRNCQFINEDFFDVKERYDVVISNPPFGIQTNFSVSAFIKKLEEVSRDFVFIYKDNTAVRQTAEREGLSVISAGGISIKRTQKFHKKDVVKIPIVVISSKPHENS